MRSRIGSGAGRCCDLERPEAAIVELAAALLVDPKDYESYVTLGQIHLDAGRYAQAGPLLTRAIATRT